MAGATASSAAAQNSQPPPNIVFLISDDHTAADLGCYGNAGVRTPYLDRMAREGMRFNQCFVASPQCSPNRSAILTGCAPHTTSTSRLHTLMPPWEGTFVDILKQRGYFAGAFRKVHQGKQFDQRWDFYGARDVPFAKFFDALPKDRPFFLHAGFTDPHRPYRAGAFSPPHDPAKVRLPNFLPDTRAVREDLALYADAIARMDAECGTIFDLLRSRGLDANTLIVFSADNGMPFPGAKGACYDPGIRVPLIARWPGRIGAGAVRDELISHVDLAPTWLQAAGAAVPAKMQGRGFLELLLGRSFQPRTEVFSERNWHDNFDPIRSARTDRYKLIFNAAPHFPYRPAFDLEGSPSWKSYLEEARRGRLSPPLYRLLQPSRPMVELYDLKEDPDEFYNVATSRTHAEALQDMKQRLGAWMHATYDFLPPAAPAAGEPVGRVWPISL